ncbi:MAG: uracil-DNA glycosylase family protein [Planctomycetota bacterium]
MPRANTTAAHRLLAEVRACRLCEPALAHGARPVLQFDPRARLLIAGQAPGSKVHASGVPFDDQSGERLRTWLGVDRAAFYDPRSVAILPMGFCYPGKGRSGDLPPRPECAATWRERLLAQLPALRWTFVVGAHAMSWHLGEPVAAAGLTAAVRRHRDFAARRMTPLPHPSPRNNPWLKANPWFERDVLPAVRAAVRDALAEG